MTLEEVEAAVEAIRRKVGDDEVAHIEEDRLHGAVLQAIANGADNPSALAAAALKTSEIQFSRWSA